jgi:hypothetical protein
MLDMYPETTTPVTASYLVSAYFTKAELKDELIAAGSSSSFGYVHPRVQRTEVSCILPAIRLLYDQFGKL